MADINQALAALQASATPSKTVTVRNITMDVFGLPLGVLTKLVRRFPDILVKLKGGNVDADKWLDVGPDGISALIAAGVGKEGDPNAESIFGRLLLPEQAAILEPIFELTVSDGLGPLAERMKKALGLEAATPSSNG